MCVILKYIYDTTTYYKHHNREKLSYLEPSAGTSHSSGHTCKADRVTETIGSTRRVQQLIYSQCDRLAAD